MAEIQPSPAFEITLQKLVYGGAALGYHDGQPVLVPFALPGERAQVETMRHAKGLAHARFLRVMEPSPERVEAPCRFFGLCGGCHYQHLNPDHHAEVKREILRETLRRIGHIDWTQPIEVHEAEPWRYRNQVRLRLGRGTGDRRAIGFFEAGSHRLVPIDACLICSPRLNELLAELSRPHWAARLEGFDELELLADDRDDEVMLTLRGATIQGAEKLANDCLRSLPGVVGARIAPSPSPGTRRHSRNLRHAASREPGTEVMNAGKLRLKYRVGEFEYEITPGSFFQASRHLLPDFVKALTEGDDLAGESALDLYAGVGLFTLPLAQRFRNVAAVEADPRAAADLARNIAPLGRARVRAVNATAADFLRRYAQRAPDLVVVDPPRAGLEAAALRRLAELGSPRLHYASCHPPALARDLAALLSHDYRLESIAVFDLFPQTFHIEAVAKLRRSG